MKLDIDSNGYVLGFAVVVCVVVSALLAATATLLRPYQLAAQELDRQRNVMVAAGLVLPDDPRPAAELRELYRQRVQERVLDLASGEFRAPLTPAEVKDPASGSKWRTVAVAMAADGRAEMAYVFPVAGRGLWSMIYGYLALDADGEHVRGVTFYKHGETPGLGGECENPDWTAKWVGKSIRDDAGELAPVRVKKGRVDPRVPAEAQHQVDGLSGATITGNGITRFVGDDLQRYAPFLRRLWRPRAPR